MPDRFIEAYKFGRIKIEGKVYTSDVILLGERVIPGWYRKEGHLLQSRDLEKVISYRPDLLIIGTGNSGVMKVSPSVKDELDFQVRSMRTKLACEKYNSALNENVKLAGAFHLTC